MRSSWRASSRRRNLGTHSGVYLVKHVCLGSLGRESGREGDLSRAAVEGV